jgi:hypothetical protein
MRIYLSCILLAMLLLSSCGPEQEDPCTESLYCIESGTCCPTGYPWHALDGKCYRDDPSHGQRIIDYCI